ncbi:MAG TPA: hydroxymethylbilane synthase [Solirubrobacteraceae bacterium]|nr:hydroxymethylbilane synthase [Solirubrobacteraceae bacterium]
MRIATRGSALALAQARWVAERLEPPGELVPIVTSGDRRRAVRDKREWVLELEEALARGDADLAVHSAKDVPVERPASLRFVAVPPRADPRDVLCGAPSLEALAPGARVGTSSLRRRAQLLARRPDVEAVEIRGNVDTRLRKLAGGEVDALILAAAGLERLGRADAADAVLDFVPAAGQGTLVVEARAGAAPLPAVDDRSAAADLDAERAVVAALGADCRSAVGVHAAGGRIRAFVGRPDGSAWLTDEVEGDDAAALIAERLLAVGARELLA